jgi:hypothetical protein
LFGKLAAVLAEAAEMKMLCARRVMLEEELQAFAFAGKKAQLVQTKIHLR